MRFNYVHLVCFLHIQYFFNVLMVVMHIVQRAGIKKLEKLNFCMIPTDVPQYVSQFWRLCFIVSIACQLFVCLSLF